MTNALPFPGDSHCFPMKKVFPVVPAFSLGLGPPVSSQTTIHGGDVPAGAPWLCCTPVGSAPVDTDPWELFRAFNSKDSIFQPSMEGRKLFFLPALHPEAVNLHPDRAEPFVHVSRSDKGDLRQREAQELPQLRVKKVSEPLDTATSSGDLSKNTPSKCCSKIQAKQMMLIQQICYDITFFFYYLLRCINSFVNCHFFWNTGICKQCLPEEWRNISEFLW